MVGSGRHEEAVYALYHSLSVSTSTIDNMLSAFANLYHMSSDWKECFPIPTGGTCFISGYSNPAPAVCVHFHLGVTQGGLYVLSAGRPGFVDGSLSIEACFIPEGSRSTDDIQVLLYEEFARPTLEGNTASKQGGQQFTDVIERRLSAAQQVVIRLRKPAKV